VLAVLAWYASGPARCCLYRMGLKLDRQGEMDGWLVPCNFMDAKNKKTKHNTRGVRAGLFLLLLFELVPGTRKFSHNTHLVSL
jgi:hypothetical protein